MEHTVIERQLKGPDHQNSNYCTIQYNYTLCQKYPESPQQQKTEPVTARADTTVYVQLS